RNKSSHTPILRYLSLFLFQLSFLFFSFFNLIHSVQMTCVLPYSAIWSTEWRKLTKSPSLYKLKSNQIKYYYTARK
ncbi:unnamed protein product, partial [Bubo scandiacus]